MTGRTRRVLVMTTKRPYINIQERRNKRSKNSFRRSLLTRRYPLLPYRRTRARAYTRLFTGARLKRRRRRASACRVTVPVTLTRFRTEFFVHTSRRPRTSPPTRAQPPRVPRTGYSDRVPNSDRGQSHAPVTFADVSYITNRIDTVAFANSADFFPAYPTLHVRTFLCSRSSTLLEVRIVFLHRLELSSLVGDRPKFRRRIYRLPQPSFSDQSLSRRSPFAFILPFSVPSNFVNESLR